MPDAPAPAAVPPPPQSVSQQLAAAAHAAASLLGLAGYVYLIGGIVSWVRFGAARLPSDIAVATLDRTTLFEVGLRAVLFSALVFTAACVVAYFAVGNWNANGPDWHEVVRQRGVRSATKPFKDENVKAAWAARRVRTLSATSARRWDLVATAVKVGPLAAHAATRAQHARAVHDAANPAAAARARSMQRIAALAERLRAPGAAAVRRRQQKAETASHIELQEPEQEQPPALTASPGPTPAPNDTVVRVVAGFNNIVLATVVGLAAVRVVESLFTYAWLAVLAVGVAAALLTWWVLVRFGPLRWRLRTHFVAWVVAAAAALFVSAAVGLLIVGAIAVATLGRMLARMPRPRSVAGLLRSPLLWALFTFYVFVALAYVASPPVTFPRAVVRTTAGTQVGGLLARSGEDVYLVTCTPLADATSTSERVVRIAGANVQDLTIGGPEDNVDSGQRPSLAALAMTALGVDFRPPTLLKLDPRLRQPTCAGAEPATLAVGNEDPQLGSGAIVGPAPPGGQAHDGELPIQDTTPAAIAQLARRYQPTLEVTVADRFWPVSVGALLEDIGANGQRTCLVSGTSTACKQATSLTSLNPAGSSVTDYLRFPAALKNDPTNQFEAFVRGQDIAPGPTDNWLTDPGVLDPWYTAQIYFFYAGPIAASSFPAKPPNPEVPSGLIGLEYWFFYPFNYYPTVVANRLMNDAPLAGDIWNTDLHQGDWEHIDVLLDPKTYKPEWLYMARHADEGVFVPWGNPTLAFDGSHPIIQAAFGGHPSYDNHCGARPRQRLLNLSSDWVVCGSGRFAFRADTTPLVDLAQTSWACWKGHFGEARPGLEVDEPSEADNVLVKARDLIYVAGPPSPLWQAENKGACTGAGPRAPEVLGAKQLGTKAAS